MLSGLLDCEQPRNIRVWRGCNVMNVRTRIEYLERIVIEQRH